MRSFRLEPVLIALGCLAAGLLCVAVLLAALFTPGGAWRIARLRVVRPVGDAVDLPAVVQTGRMTVVGDAGEVELAVDAVLGQASVAGVGTAQAMLHQRARALVAATESAGAAIGAARAGAQFARTTGAVFSDLAAIRAAGRALEGPLGTGGLAQQGARLQAAVTALTGVNLLP